MTHVPRSWDTALEALLTASNLQSAKPRWSDRIIDTIQETKTFLDAINRHVIGATDGPGPKKHIEDPARVRENHIRHMIQAPLPPRKPIVIPCPYAAVKQRDKQKLERVIRQRTTAASLGIISMPHFPKENCRIARRPNVGNRSFSSMTSTKRTFYWGA
jgi:hypothetical protein